MRRWTTCAIHIGPSQNFYMIRLQEVGDLFPIIQTRSDEFTNGNEQDEFFEKDDDDDNPDNQFDPGDSVNIKLFGISERYYNFITLLVEQYDSAGNPFATTPAEIRGNCVNLTNSENGKIIEHRKWFYKVRLI